MKRRHWHLSSIASPLLAALAACGSEAEAPRDVAAPAALAPIIVQDRFSVSRSQYGAEATLARLFEALDRRELMVFAVIDHRAGAEGVGAELPFSTVVIFGDPSVGTPLIEAVPLMGAVLPLRALVYEQDGSVYLAVTGVDHLLRDYPLGERAGVIDRIRASLDEIGAEVTAG